jgi:hypothetical protein
VTDGPRGQPGSTIRLAGRAQDLNIEVADLLPQRVPVHSEEFRRLDLVARGSLQARPTAAAFRPRAECGDRARAAEDCPHTPRNIWKGAARSRRSTTRPCRSPADRAPRGGGPGSPVRARCPASGSGFRRSSAPASICFCGRPSRAASAKKCRIRSGTSSVRSRSGGSAAAPRSGGRTDPRGTALLISWRRSLLVAATMRTSVLIGVRPPTVVYSPCCSTRSRRVCASIGMSPISSRNSVPPSACSKRPARARIGAGEGALLVAEQFALDQIARDRRHVDGHERPVAALAVIVQRARHQFLAGAGLAVIITVRSVCIRRASTR